MPYHILRTCNWLYDLLCSSIGITAFISLIGLLLPQNSISSALPPKEQLKRQEENDKLHKRRIVISLVILFSLLILAIIRFSGCINVEDVFNGQYKYVGQTLNSKADGKGKQYTLKDTLVYDGELEVNQYSGEGKYYKCYSQDDGSEINRLRYEGSFKNGLYNGFGKKYDAAEDDVDENGVEKPCLIYEGNFRDNSYHGEGTSYSYTKISEEEESKLPEGIELELPLGYYLSTVYKGQWKDGVKNGHGINTEYDKDGSEVRRYTGEYKDGTYNGVGILEFVDQSEQKFGEVIYHGEFEDGTFSGEGIFYNADGSVNSVRNGATKSEEELIKEFPYPEENIWK